MRKFIFLFAICFLGAILAVAQSSTQLPSAQQAQPATSPSSAQPPKAPAQSQPAQPTPPSGDNSVSGSEQQNPNQSSGTSGSQSAQQNPNGAPADQGRAAQPQRAGNGGGGLPWAWIIIGIFAVIILIGIATRGSSDADRVEHIDRVERIDRDDQRRVG